MEVGEGTLAECERVYIFLPRESGECKHVRVNLGFPSSELLIWPHKRLPIGIILSFVFLTSMKLPSLVFFFFLLLFLGGV